ncbi:hypothetical protein KRX54_03655 [Actinomycetaceae bacterium TAE3-ERU4]|nr:hypothetical protein [Actinomycetaceae bacterium TAE3-ERU4]
MRANRSLKSALIARKNTENGEATLEFIGLTALLILPLLYLIFSLAQVQNAAYAANSAAQSAASLYAVGTSPARVNEQIEQLQRDYDLDIPLEVSVECGKCTLGQTVWVRVVARANLPGSNLGNRLANQLSIPVEARFVSVIVRKTE